MTILHYIPSIDETSGGVGAYMQLLTRDLGKLCDLHVVTHKGDNERVLENCAIHYIPYKWKPWNNCKHEFLTLLEEIKPDVFHTNCCWMPLSALTVMWCDKWRHENSLSSKLSTLSPKIVYTPHGMLEPYSIKRHYLTKKLPAIILFQKAGIKVPDMIHATAETEKKNLLKLGWNNKVHVIPNCVQIDEIEMKTSWKRTKNILFLSRVHPKKGINFLIEAVGKLKNDFVGYTITIAGPGDESYFDELVAVCKKNNLKVESFHNNTLTSNLSPLTTNEPIVRFIGSIYGDTKWPLYRHADLFVLPTYSENFGIVVPEALASGTPVITTYGTPWAEINGSELRDDSYEPSINNQQSTINNQQCGWCIEVGTQPLVEALRKFLICSDKELEVMGTRGRKLVEDKYTSEAVAKKFLKMYTQLCKKQK